MKKIYLWCFLSFIPSLVLIAQTKREMSLEEALSIAYEKNSSLKIAYEDLKVYIADYKTTNAIYMPQVSLSESYVATNNPMQVFGINLQQTSITSSDFAPDKLNNPSTTDNWNSMVSVRMPIFNLDKIYERKAAKEAMESRSSMLKRSFDLIGFEVKKAYYALQLSSVSVKVAHKSKQTSQAALKRVRSLSKEGMATSADLSLAQVHLLKSENQQLLTKSNYKKANRYLTFLLGLDLDTEVTPIDKLGDIEQTGFDSQTSVSKERADLVAKLHQVNALYHQVKKNQMGWVPSLNGMANYSLNSDEIFQNTSNSYWIGVTLQWNIFQGGVRWNQNKKHKAEYRKAKIEFSQMQKKADMELQNMQDQLLLYRQQSELMHKAFLQAKETYAIQSNRYNEGLEQTADLLLSQTEMEQLHWKFLQSQYQSALAYFQLQLMLQK
ncbi:TolC family protein [Halosquirtibacter laminarini]|uniref:TolC family protein n=1 Tax=Halosquirtibacter laminarini TaxID=3374600 RepID=A0AC61NC13_9BACT|nr:TolC family protein [Prolixibacteraceae bacterium]